MKRDIRTIGILFVGLLVVSGIAVGATLSGDSLFADNEEVDSDVVLMPEDTAQGDAYAELVDDDELRIEIEDLNPDSSATVDDVFNATFNADTDNSEAKVYFETGNEDVEIRDSDDEVVNEDNPVEFDSDGQDETFSIDISDTGTDGELISQISVVAEADDGLLPGKPVSFNGTVTDGEKIPLENTTIVATRNGVEVDNATTDEDGVYGTSGFGDGDFAFEANAGDEINFYVREVDGPAAQINTYEIEESDLETEDDEDRAIIEEDLEFDPGTFDLQVKDLNINKTEEVGLDETLTVSANLTNNGSEELTQDATLIVNDEDTDQVEEDVSVAGGENESVQFEYEVDQSSDFDLGIRTADDRDSQLVELDSNIAFEGAVTDGERPAPNGTTIVAEVDGSTTSVDVEDGEYSDLGLVVQDDSEVNFTIRDENGQEAEESPYAIQENDIGNDTVVDLTFDEGTFDLKVEDFEVSETDDVPLDDEITVEANLTNDGGTSLTQDAVFTVDDQEIETDEDVEVDAGNQTEVDFTYTVTTSDTFEVEISTDDDSANETVTVDGIDNVVASAFDNDFAGIVMDDDDLGVTATVEGSEAATNGSVPLQLNTSDSTVIEIGTVTADDGEIDATIDPTDVPADTEVGEDAALEVAGVETGTAVTLIHEAQNLSTGAVATSTPQPAQLHAEGDFSVTQWDDSEQSYSSSAIDADGEFTDTVAVHRGLYVLTNDPEFRLGYEFQSHELDEDIELSEGWNLVSSNYNISDADTVGTIDVEGDLDIDADFEDLTVINVDGTVQNADDTAEPYAVYWVRAEDGDTRTIDDSEYNAPARAN